MPRLVTCHPEREYASKGLCGACYQRKWRKTHPPSKEQLKRRSITQRRWRKRNVVLRRNYNRVYGTRHRSKWLKEAHQTIFDWYGKKCSCCGENEQLFLTIDHINNDGAKLRRSFPRSGTSFYLWLARQIRKKSAPIDLQTLCYNCNCGKQRNKGICPHQEQ